MRYWIFLLLFFSSFSFAANPNPTCASYSTWSCNPGASDAGPTNQCLSNSASKGFLETRAGCGWMGAGAHEIRCGSNCTCPAGFTYAQGTDINGNKTSGCTPNETNPNDECNAGYVKNIETGACEIKTECVYPQLYDFYTNSCQANPLNCAIGAKANPLSPGTCMATGETSCPSSGWAISADGLNCSATGSSASNTSSPSSTGSNTSNTNNSTAASNSNTSTGSNTSSGNGGNGGNTGGGNTGGGDTGGNTSSGSNSSWTPHSGYGNWIPISANSPCPNKYQDANGQWWCSAANTGSASSAAGQCDPTAKDYLACISQQASGNTSSSGSNSSACNPASADFEQCNAAQQAGTKMKELGDKFKEETTKEMDKFKKAVDDDLSNFQRDGLTFKDEPSRLRSLLTRLLPASTPCSPPPLQLFGETYNLDCFYFDIFKQALGWFLAILTVFNIWQLATRPVNR